MRRWGIALIVVALLPLVPASRASAASCAMPAGGFGVSVKRYVPFVNRFGETIAVDLYMPTDASGTVAASRGCRRPVVLQSSPYRDWTSPQPTKPTEDDARRWWVQQGYVFAFADVPGAGGSDGTWCLFCRHEQLSGVDIVNALGSQPWSNGNVGMIGGSYPAINAMLIAQHHPKHLKAVIAAAFLLDPYRDMFYVGGMRRFEDAAVLMAAFTGLSRWTGQYGVPDDPQRFATVWSNRLTAPPPEFLTIQDDHPTRDAWYEERTVHPERIHVPVYLLGGWHDIFDDSVWRAYDRIGSNTKFLLHGPFTHVPLFMPPGAWPCPTQGTDFCGAGLFDRFLKDESTAAWRKLRSTPVRTYVGPSGPYRSGTHKPRTVPWTMPLGRKGATATLHYDPAAGMTSGRWFMRGSVPGAAEPYDTYLGFDGPSDQRVEEQTGLSFASEPLKRDVTVIGPGKVTLRVTPSASDADVVVRVVDEWPTGSTYPGGYNTLVNSGWLRASHRGGHAAAQIRPLEPGKPVTLTIDIWPIGRRFAKGHRIRIDIQTSDVPRFEPMTQPFDLNVDLGASRISLPRLR